MMFGILIVVTALATIISEGEMSSRVTKVGAEVYRGFLDIERTGALKILYIGRKQQPCVDFQGWTKDKGKAGTRAGNQ